MKPALDELVGWSLDGKGRVTGLDGVRDRYPVHWLTRILLPGIGPGFAQPGDLLEIERNSLLFEEQLCGLTNFTQRRTLAPDTWRCLLCAAILLVLPLPSLLAGRYWLFALFAIGAGLFLYFNLNSRAARFRDVAEDYARTQHSIWRILEGRLPPGIIIREGPEPDWLGLLSQAFAGTLEHCDTVELGILPVPDGQLIASEPFRIDRPGEYTIAVPPGSYPVFLAVGSDPEGIDQRVAYAWVRLGDGTPASWEPARNADGAEVTVGVDSGIAGFVSAACAPAFTAAYHRDYCDFEAPLSDAIVAEMDKVWRSTRGWAMMEAGDGARLAAFSSGFGDGVYPVYRGLDAQGRCLAVAIVFFVHW